MVFIKVVAEYMTTEFQDNFSVYLDDSKTGALFFKDAVARIIVKEASQIQSAFDKIRKYLDDGLYVAGWISYEAGLYLEERLTKLAQPSYAVPFLSFGVYEAPIILNVEESEAYWEEKSNNGHVDINNVKLSLSRDEYNADIAKIHEYLRAGDIYQVNYTLKTRFDFSGSAESYFAKIRKAQRVEYGAFIKSSDLSVLSHSPELFFEKQGKRIMVRPMKGTYARGRNEEEDNINTSFIRGDKKNRAENLMIVDLLRNDLAKISLPASVKLKSLYDVEKYRTLIQMTSTIEAEVSDTIHIIDLIKALFPCGSVTGAPKIRAMEIISELEKSPRGIYTGAIGYMAPNGNCCFSVPIRTLTIDKNGQGEMGIGSAIVADSTAQEEYDECLLKTKFTMEDIKDFDLIETIRCSQNKEGSMEYDFLDLHMARLKSSAVYFGFIFDGQAILQDLVQHRNYLNSDMDWKVRLTLSPTGNISITSAPLDIAMPEQTNTITLSDQNVDSRNPMIFHKTTDRSLYDHQLSHHKKAFDSYDVIFINEIGELTEGSYNNLFLLKNDILYTPKITSGLLNGILRQSLMNDPEYTLVEKNLTVADLTTVDKIFMGNSVRGLKEVIYK